MLYFLSQSAHY